MIGQQPTGAIPGVVITAVAHEGLTVQINGRPGKLAVLDEAGNVIAAGPAVAREAEAVALNCYRQVLRGQGHLRVWGEDIAPPAAAVAIPAPAPAPVPQKRRAAAAGTQQHQQPHPQRPSVQDPGESRSEDGERLHGDTP